MVAGAEINVVLRAMKSVTFLGTVLRKLRHIEGVNFDKGGRRNECAHFFYVFVICNVNKHLCVIVKNGPFVISSRQFAVVVGNKVNYMYVVK